MALTHTHALWSLYGGTVGIVAAVAWGFSTEQFRETATRTDGRVVELVKDSSSGYDNAGPTYAPRFEFTTPDGENWSVLSTAGTSPSAFEVGDRVKVLYKPENPAHARIDSATQLWMGPVILGVIAVIAMVVGFIALQS